MGIPFKNPGEEVSEGVPSSNQEPGMAEELQTPLSGPGELVRRKVRRRLLLVVGVLFAGLAAVLVGGPCLVGLGRTKEFEAFCRQLKDGELPTRVVFSETPDPTLESIIDTCRTKAGVAVDPGRASASLQKAFDQGFLLPPKVIQNVYNMQPRKYDKTHASGNR